MKELLQSLELHPVRIPMRHRFRRIDHREAVLIRGPSGWGEFSPFPDYPPEVTTRWLASALEAACSMLPEPGRDTVAVNVTVPAVDPGTAADIVVTSRSKTAKVKVAEPGEDPHLEEARVAAVRDALGPDGAIRVDVNAAWDVDTAASRLEVLGRYGLEYAEQPVATIDEMIQLKERIDVPLAADELVRLSADPLEVVSAGAADVLVLKVQPLGGVGRLVDLATRAGIPVVVSSALETSVGLYSGLLAASLVTADDVACGLGTAALLDGDATSAPLLPVEGRVVVQRPEPDRALLKLWRPDRDRAAEMLRKVRAAAEVLT